MKKILLIIPCLFLIIAGCENEEEKLEDKIIGKWVIEATGVTEDNMYPHNPAPYGINDDYFEFLPNKTVWHHCGSCVGEKYFQVATYKIDSEHYYWYTGDSDVPDIYFYSFYDDKLKITSINPRNIGHEMVKITNVIIYKRIK